MDLKFTEKKTIEVSKDLGSESVEPQVVDETPAVNESQLKAHKKLSKLM